MAHFIHPIIIGEEKKYFAFTKVGLPDTTRFSVTTLDNNNIIRFDVEMIEFDRWELSESIPEWIRDAEPAIIDVVKKFV